MEAYVYTMIDESTLNELLGALHVCIDLPVQLLDENGRILKYFGKKNTYCQHFSSHFSSEKTCMHIHSNAGKRAMNLGSSYIFSCQSNLSHIVFPLINHESLFGSILIGPFLMERADSTLVLDVGHKFPIFSMEDLMELYDDAADVPQVDPSKVTQISRLLYFLMSSLISDSREQFIINQKKLHQQARISESIQMYKTMEPVQTDRYPLEKEQELLTKVKEGNLKESSALLNDLLGYVFLSAGNNLATVKYRSVELCSLLSRAAIENGAASSHIFSINNQFMEHVDTYRSTTELCYAMIEILTSFMGLHVPAHHGKQPHCAGSHELYFHPFCGEYHTAGCGGTPALKPILFLTDFQTLQRLYLQGVPDHGAGGGGQTAAETTRMIPCWISPSA